MYIDRDRLLAHADLSSPKVKFHISLMTIAAMIILFGGLAYFAYR